MKKKRKQKSMVLFLVVIIAAVLIGLFLIAFPKESENSRNREKEQTTQNSEPSYSAEEQIIDLKGYNGDWSLDGFGYNHVLENGGAYLKSNISEDNEFRGNIFTQQGSGERFAEFEIEGKVQGNQLEYVFDEDGWGGSGTICLTFEENKIIAKVTDYKMAEDNASGYGINGSYEFVKCTKQDAVTESEWKDIDISKMTEEELLAEINKRNPYYQSSGYYDKVVEYWENVRNVTDIENRLEPLYRTDENLFTENDFQDTPDFIIHLAKNEIYARHGYVFKDEDLNNYFMGCLWYQPMAEGEAFDDSVFSEIEKQNLELLSKLDTE